MDTRVEVVSIQNIKPFAWQPISRMRDTTDLQLSQAVLAAEFGNDGIIRRPIVCSNSNGGYDCLVGNRTVAAKRQRGFKEIEVEVRDGLTEQQKVMLLIHSNIQRSLSRVELAVFAFRLIYGRDATQGEEPLDRKNPPGMARNEAAKVLGVSRTEICILERLAVAPVLIQDAVDAGKITWSTFKRDLAPLPADKMVVSVDEMVATADPKPDNGVQEAPRVQDALEDLATIRQALTRLMKFARVGDASLVKEAWTPVGAQLLRLQRLLLNEGDGNG